MRNNAYSLAAGLLLFASASAIAAPRDMPWVAISADQRGFVLAENKGAFTPWGFNYDHDERGRLLEDYWLDEWPLVEEHFAQMKKLGANVVRIHLQTGKFLDSPEEANKRSLEQLGLLLELAERTGLYLDLTGLGSAFAGKHFVQFITLDQQKRPRPEIAAEWVRRLTAAIRRRDPRHLITVGLVDWSLDRPGLTSGFVPEKVAKHLDFVSVHIYPERGKIEPALTTLAGFAVGKPVVIEETFPLKCSADELERFIESSRRSAAGWISFYWGKSPERLQASGELGDAILLDWLKRFEKLAPATQ